MGRYWKPRGSRWLSPAAYNALSPAEKRALHFERQKYRTHERPARYRKGYYARQRQAWLLGVLAFGALASQLGIPFADFPTEETAPVTIDFGLCHTGGGTNCVVDGDTFWIGGQKVRIAGIDAPETHPPRCAEEARLGNEATAMLRGLLNGGAVTMTSIDRDQDSYGRLLRNVAVDGQDVGEAMIAAGVAREYGRGRRSWC